VGGEALQQPGVAPADALRLAVEALQAGRHDPRLPDGAQANALESIAWSLVGLLARDVSAAPSAQTPVLGDAQRTLSEDLRRAGFVHLEAKR
jgi:hypothetical protein